MAIDDSKRAHDSFSHIWIPQLRYNPSEPRKLRQLLNGLQDLLDDQPSIVRRVERDEVADRL